MGNHMGCVDNTGMKNLVMVVRGQRVEEEIG